MMERKAGRAEGRPAPVLPALDQESRSGRDQLKPVCRPSDLSKQDLGDVVDMAADRRRGGLVSASGRRYRGRSGEPRRSYIIFLPRRRGYAVAASAQAVESRAQSDWSILSPFTTPAPGNGG